MSTRKWSRVTTKKRPRRRPISEVSTSKLVRDIAAGFQYFTANRIAAGTRSK